MINRSVIVALAMMAPAAFAGTQLHMNSGVVETARVQAQWSQYFQLNTQAAQDLIVQFKGKITASDKALLRSLGAEIFGYLPEDALVVRMSSHNLQKLRESGSVHAVIGYAPGLKLSPSFGSLSVFNQSQTDVVLISTFKAAESEVLAQKMEKISSDIIVERVEGRFIVAIMPKKFVMSVASLTGVEHVQPHPQMETMHMALEKELDQLITTASGDYKDLSGFETGTKVMNFDGAWALGLTGKGQVASMADTGLDSGDTNTVHPDFKGRVVSGHAVGLFGKTWADPMGHGTHVAGSIVGNGAAGNGSLKGGAYEARFVAQGMWSPVLDNLSVPSKLGDMFAKAYRDGARIHSNSWGAARNFGAYDNFAMQVDEYMFNNPDMLVVFAAGNSGVDANKDGRIDSGSMSSPGTAKNTLTVGASENKVSTGGIQVPISKLRSGKDQWGAEPIFSSLISDNENGIAMFSSRGPTNDGRVKPDVVAPGTNILSVKSQQPKASDMWGAYNKDYVWSGGTSMATPLVAGAATVLRQYLVEKKGLAQPSAALMKAALMNRAIDMYPGQYGEGGARAGQELLTRRPNSDQGYGRVDAQALVSMDQTVLVDETRGVATNQSKTFQFQVTKPSKLTANLVWTDAPGSTNAAKALVNDLDLNLSGPGVGLTPADRTNNHEVIEAANLAPGTYTLEVRGVNVPQGKGDSQPFALVYTLE